jgi:hypothetical protein
MVYSHGNVFHREEQWNHVNGFTIKLVDIANQATWDIKDVKARVSLFLCIRDNQLVHVKS